MFSPDNFDSYDVGKQLRCAGMLEAIRIRSQGYAIRVEMEDFVKRYRTVFGPKANASLPQSMTLKDQCQAIFKEA